MYCERAAQQFHITRWRGAGPDSSLLDRNARSQAQLPRGVIMHHPEKGEPPKSEESDAHSVSETDLSQVICCGGRGKREEDGDPAPPPLVSGPCARSLQRSGLHRRLFSPQGNNGAPERGCVESLEKTLRRKR
ncbi:hypothetical protein NDU88_006113 [Pleurodeles waltl]|uniref:Uncharacterized protein n=1 Tax=Pleurodeles waltl TaxID=8319 RepID=A0AAV7MD61_PLEWA|nr:hypothetical protein NDU88_006113 [Pleurodeles waltl]